MKFQRGDILLSMMVPMLGTFIPLLLPLMVRHAHSKLQARAIYFKDVDASLQDALKYIFGTGENLDRNNAQFLHSF